MKGLRGRAAAAARAFRCPPSPLPPVADPPSCADDGLIGHGVLGLPDDDHGSPARGTALYRFFGFDGDLLYVGVSCNFGSRWKDHAASKAWYGDIYYMTVVWYSGDSAAGVAERQAIKAERPRYNVTHNPSRRQGQRWRQRPSAPPSTPEAVAARKAYRRSVRAGRPLSDRTLGAMYGRGRAWGGNRIREVKEAPNLTQAQ